jgi:hypothetical protein
MKYILSCIALLVLVAPIYGGYLPDAVSSNQAITWTQAQTFGAGAIISDNQALTFNEATDNAYFLLHNADTDTGFSAKIGGTGPGINYVVNGRRLITAYEAATTEPFIDFGNQTDWAKGVQVRLHGGGVDNEPGAIRLDPDTGSNVIYLYTTTAGILKAHDAYPTDDETQGKIFGFLENTQTWSGVNTYSQNIVSSITANGSYFLRYRNDADTGFEIVDSGGSLGFSHRIDNTIAFQSLKNTFNHSFYVGSLGTNARGVFLVQGGGFDNRCGLMGVQSDTSSSVYWYFFTDSAGALKALNTVPTDDDTEGYILAFLNRAQTFTALQTFNNGTGVAISALSSFSNAVEASVSGGFTNAAFSGTSTATSGVVYRATTNQASGVGYYAALGGSGTAHYGFTAASSNGEGGGFKYLTSGALTSNGINPALDLARSSSLASFNYTSPLVELRNACTNGTDPTAFIFMTSTETPYNSGKKWIEMTAATGQDENDYIFEAKVVSSVVFSIDWAGAPTFEGLATFNNDVDIDGDIDTTGNATIDGYFQSDATSGFLIKMLGDDDSGLQQNTASGEKVLSLYTDNIFVWSTQLNTTTGHALFDLGGTSTSYPGLFRMKAGGVDNEPGSAMLMEDLEAGGLYMWTPTGGAAKGHLRALNAYPTDDDTNGNIIAAPASYGELYEDNDGGTGITCTNANTFYQWVTTTVGTEKGTGFVVGSTSSDDLTIGTNGAGKYKVSFSVSFDGTASKSFEWAVFKNSTEQVQINSRHEFGATVTDASISGSGFVTLAATDTLELHVQCITDAGNSVTVYKANLNAIRVEAE